MTSLLWFIAGSWTVMGIVIVFETLKAHKARRQERAFLDMYTKILGVMPKIGESNLELRDRLTRELRR